LNFDIHVYWRNKDERYEALQLQKILIENIVQYFPFVEKAIGPYPFLMFESHVTSQDLPAIEKLLIENGGN
jgi:aromatic ring-cleaving dioxygenase